MVSIAFAAALFSIIASFPQDPAAPAQPPLVDPLGSLEFQTGKVAVGSGLATFDVPEGFGYLQKEDAKRVVEDFWGNPPSPTTIGLIAPGGLEALLKGGWAIIVSYEPSGYVEDDDAKDIDFNDLLKGMQEDARAANPERKKLGYQSVDLLGWAEPPHYDSAAKKLYWAKRLQFEGEPQETLNYNTRILGRRGVLELEAVGAMGDLAPIAKAVQTLLPRIEFNKGHRYEEFDSKLDDVAAYGIGGLIAGKVLAKAGLFAILAKFAKVIVIGVVALFAALRRMLGGKKEAPPTAS